MAAVSLRLIGVAALFIAVGAGCSNLPWSGSAGTSLGAKPNASGERFAWFKNLSPGRRGRSSRVGSEGLGPTAVASTQAESGSLAKMGDSISSSRIVQGVKGAWDSGTDKLAGLGGKKPALDGDPISLNSPTSRPDAALHISMAQLQERSGNVVRAEDQYRKALKVDSKNLKALVGLAHMFDRMGRLEEATTLYVQATKHNDKEPGPFNDLALCYAKQGKFDQAITNLNRAITLQPYRKLYRNNIATMYVETGRPDAALQHLIQAHGESIAHYNLGFMLRQKGEPQMAAFHFAKAVEIDPSFTEAREWLAVAAPAAITPAARQEFTPGPTNLSANPAIANSRATPQSAVETQIPAQAATAAPHVRGTPQYSKGPPQGAPTASLPLAGQHTDASNGPMPGSNPIQTPQSSQRNATSPMTRHPSVGRRYPSVPSGRYPSASLPRNSASSSQWGSSTTPPAATSRPSGGTPALAAGQSTTPPSGQDGRDDGQPTQDSNAWTQETREALIPPGVSAPKITIPERDLAPPGVAPPEPSADRSYYPASRY